MSEDQQLNPFLEELIKCATKRGIEVTSVPGNNLLYRFSFRDVDRVVAGSLTSLDSHIGSVMCSNKILSHSYLQGQGLAVPRQVDLSRATCADQVLRIVGGYPCVVKPSRGEKGVGVTVGIRTAQELCKAIDLAADTGCGVPLLQGQVAGKNFRVTVLGGRIFFAAQLIPAQPGIPVNSATGSRREYCTAQLHPQTEAACLSIAKDLGLHCLGFDLMTWDIGKPNPVFLEINSFPTLHPYQAGDFLDSLGFGATI